MLAAVIGPGYTMINEADRTPALEEFIIYSKGLQNTALGQIQAKSGFDIFKGLFKRKIKEGHATENVYGSKSLHY